MQRTRITNLIIVSLAILCPTYAMATDLLQVYQQALTFDPTLQKAAAARLSIREGVAQSSATLLPSLSGQASTTEYRSRTSYTGSAPIKSVYGNNVYSLTLSQSIFNFANWMNLRQAEAAAKQADATYAAALQDLMLRSAKAYFGVLQAQDAVRITQAQKKLLASQLDEAKQRFDVGLNTMTEVYNAQANYDATVAKEITDINDVNNKYEDLRSISGQRFDNLAILGKKIPLITPNPASPEKWVKAAEEQNLVLLAARFSVDAARENIKVKAAGHLPTLSASGTYSHSTGGPNVPLIPNATEGSNLGLTLSVPVFQGGAVMSLTRQAQYDFQRAAADMEINHQTILAKTRQTYASVLAGVSKIAADKATIKSARSAYESNVAAYQVGTKTNVDVLLAQKNLFDAQRQYSADQYLYLMDTLVLKAQAGTLNEQDLKTINSWLKIIDEEEAQASMEKKLAVKPVTPAKKMTRSDKKKLTKQTDKL